MSDEMGTTTTVPTESESRLAGTEQVKHPATPGPWKVTKCDDGLLMVHTDGDTICFGDLNHSDPDDSANFALIVAAPDMLAALKYVFDHMADPERGPRDLYPAFGLNSGRALEMVRAAITKAQGRTP